MKNSAGEPREAAPEVGPLLCQSVAVRGFGKTRDLRKMAPCPPAE